MTVKNLRLTGNIYNIYISKHVKGDKSFTLHATYRHNLFLARVDDADLLVLAGGAQQAAVAAPADTKDNIRVHVLQIDYGLSCAHIPDDDLVVTP